MRMEFNVLMSDQRMRQWKYEGPAADIVAAAELQQNVRLLDLQAQGASLRAQIARERKDLVLMVGSIMQVAGTSSPEIAKVCSELENR